MLIIRFIITCAIPDIPGWLATEMAKIEWARREASRITNSTPSPEEITAKLIGRFSVSPSHSADRNTENMRKSNEKLKQLEHEPQKEPTPLVTPTTPGTSSSTSSHKGVGGVTIESIQQIPPFRPRKSKEWAVPEVREILYQRMWLLLMHCFIREKQVITSLSVQAEVSSGSKDSKKNLTCIEV